MGEKKKIRNATKQFPREFILCILLALSVFLIFFPTIRYGTIYYDDMDYVGADNPQVPNGLTKNGIVWAFTTGHSANWHPLTWLSHMLDVEMFGNKPFGAHFTNVLFHALNSMLVFLVLKKMTGAIWRSAFVAALFGLHPLHVESVAWISERKDVLSTFFWLLAIWSYKRYVEAQNSRVNDAKEPRHPTIFYFLTLVFFAFGLMSKPMVVTLPFVLLLLDIWPLNRISISTLKQDVPRLIFEKIPFFTLTIVSSVITFIAQQRDGAVSSLAAFPLAARVENAFVSYARYVGKMFWPIDLALMYPRPSEWPIWRVCASALLLLGISAWAIRSLRRQPFFFTGWFWFLGTLVPVIGLVQVGSQAMADRYTYVPLVGLFVLVTWLATELLMQWRFSRIVTGFLATILLLLCVVLTRQQIGYWRNTELLFRHAAKVTDKNYAAYDILGLYYFDQGRHAEAIEAYRKSIEMSPTYPSARNNLGFALGTLGSHEDAIEHLQAALKINPAYIEAHNNLGISLAAIGKVDEAISHYEFALAKNPRHAQAHNNLGVALMMRGDSADAIEHFRAACKLKPDYLNALNALAWILATHPNEKFRSGTEALSLASQADVLTDGKNAGVLETLAAAYAEYGDFANAIKTAQTAMELAKTAIDGEMAERLKSALQLYQANQPWRDPDMK